MIQTFSNITGFPEGYWNIRVAVIAQARPREIRLIITNISSKRLFNTPYNFIYLLDKTKRNEKIAGTIKLKVIL